MKNALESKLEMKTRDTAMEAKRLLASHDNSLNALQKFQIANAKGGEAQIHPAEFAHVVLAEYAKMLLVESSAN